MVSATKSMEFLTAWAGTIAKIFAKVTKTIPPKRWYLYRNKYLLVENKSCKMAETIWQN